MRCLPYGPAAVLVDDLDVAPAIVAQAIRRQLASTVIDVVPAARTVLVTCADQAARAGVVAAMTDLAVLADRDPQPVQLVEIAVRYDGPDLEAVASHAGLSADEIIGIHSGATYQVAFCGFAPGFGYLTGLDRRLWLPRRDTPRTRVPGGSVAIAAEYTAVYPSASPGGWHLLGTTDVVLFDPHRRRPSLLTPGDHVRFQVR